jgi:carbonic anhydrase
MAHAHQHGHPNTYDDTPYPQDWAIKDLLSGNHRFANKVNVEYPDLIDQTGKKQHPPFMFIGCVDSRVSEGTIFDAPPGTLFSLRNIANQYVNNDIAGVSAVAYGVNHLNVTHVVITGHYGCGGVATAIASPSPDLEPSIELWIQPIRELYATSTRPEIVALRTENANNPNVPPPANDNPGFRALVEENVKLNVARLASSLIQNKASSKREIPLLIHGFVYDVATAAVKDLHVTTPVEFAAKL